VAAQGEAALCAKLHLSAPGVVKLIEKSSEMIPKTPTIETVGYDGRTDIFDPKKYLCVHKIALQLWIRGHSAGSEAIIYATRWAAMAVGAHLRLRSARKRIVERIQ
jgi:hypothetical protein